LSATSETSLTRVQGVLTAIDTLLAQVGSSNQRAGETLRAATHLEQGASAIQKITELVRRLAMQLKILAINASIEAARAGVQGRGFAVVAQEMGRLSEQTSQAMVRVDSVTGGLLNSIHQVVEAAGANQREMVKAAGSTAAAQKDLTDVAATYQDWLAATAAMDVSLGNQAGAVEQLHEQVAQMLSRTEQVKEQVSHTTSALRPPARCRTGRALGVLAGDVNIRDAERLGKTAQWRMATS
jgi:methyl-accepting chemotaxis protein